MVFRCGINRSPNLLNGRFQVFHVSRSIISAREAITQGIQTACESGCSSGEYQLLFCTPDLAIFRNLVLRDRLSTLCTVRNHITSRKIPVSPCRMGSSPVMKMTFHSGEKLANKVGGRSLQALVGLT
jgi:hypothetical protein